MNTTRASAGVDHGLIVVGEDEELMLLPPWTVDKKNGGEAMEILATAAMR